MRIRLLLFSCCFLALMGCVGPVGETAWREVSGGSVVLRSCLSEDETLSLARDLELVRGALRGLLPDLPPRDRVPFELTLLCDGADYVSLAPRPDPGNHFVTPTQGRYRAESRYEARKAAAGTTAGGTRMVVRASQLRGARDLVLHHYVHHALRAQVEVPLWLEEGLAGFLGTVRWEGAGMRLGQAASGMQPLLDLPLRVRRREGSRFNLDIPVGWVLRATDLRTWPIENRSLFYRNSWLLLHYMHFGKAGDGVGPAARIARYRAAIANGADAQRACEVSFGTRTVGLRSALESYATVHEVFLANGRSVALPGGAAWPALSTVALSGAEWDAHRGRLALDNRDGARARDILTRALQQDPSAAALHSALARAHALEGDWASASAALAEAEARAPRSARVLLDGAAVLALRRGVGDPAAIRARLEPLLSKWAGDGEALALVAASYGEEAPARRLAALRLAHAAFPGAIEVGLGLARALAEADRPQQARAVATRMAAWTLGEVRWNDVVAFLGRLDRAREATPSR